MRTRTHAAVSRNDDEDTDLNLLPPVCYLTRPLNALLLHLLKYCFDHRQVVLPIAGVIYLALIAIFSEDWLIVVMAPLGLALFGILGHTGISIVLLAFLARHPGTRLTCAALLHVIIIGPFLILALSDTLLLAISEHAAFGLLIAHLIGMIFFYLHYGQRLVPYARWSLPLLILSLTLLWFESGQAFAYSRISPDQFELLSCTDKTTRASGSTRLHTHRVCDVHLTINGSRHRLHGMRLPPGPVDHLEVRHAVFDHYRLR